VALDGLDHHDRIVDHEPDGEHQGHSDSVLTEKRAAGNTANVRSTRPAPAISGIKVARQLCRNRNTTSATSSVVTRRVIKISRMPSVTGAVVSMGDVRSQEVGRKPLLQLRHSRLDPVGDAIAFDPGVCIRTRRKMSDGFPLNRPDLVVRPTARLDAGQHR